MNPLLAAALDYATRGWPVLPLRPRGKEPLTPHGVKDATTDAAAIEAWWRRWPTANVGIACGQGLLVVDLDPRAGSDFSWPELVGEREVPPGPEVQTGGGGRHLYFAGEGRGGQLAPGVELKGAGGYVVAPPSVHPSGRRYVWVIGRAPGEVELPPLPEWLRPQRAPADRPVGEKITQGQRNNTLNRAAGALRRLGFDGPGIFAALKGLNTALCDPPLPEAEVRSIAFGSERWLPAEPLVKAEVLSAAQLLALPAPARQWTVDGLLLEGGTSLLVAKPKVGKSTFARALAVAVARGERFLGRDVLHGPVLYIAFEGRLEDHRDHLVQLGLGADDPFFLAPSGNRDDMSRWVAELRPVVVVVDTLGHLQRARDGNAYLEVMGDLGFVIQLSRETGAHLLLLHHASKTADARSAIDAVLGSTAYSATVDTIIRLKRREDGTRTFEVEHRVGDPLPETVVALSGGRLSVAGEYRFLELHRVKAQILDMTPQGLTQVELQEALEVRRDVVYAALRELVAEGRLIQQGTGRRGDPRRFFLSPGTSGDTGDRISKLPEKSVGSDTNSVPESLGTESRLNFDNSDWFGRGDP